MHLGVLGNYGATNVGDEAILSAILKAHAGYEFTVFSANPADTEERHKVKAVPLFPLGFRSFFKHGFRRSLKALRSVDAIVLGGGGLFQDDRLYACFLWAWQCFWVYRANKPLFIYSIGAGPLRTKLGRWFTRYALSKASVITVRDEASKKLLEEIGLKDGEIHVTADPAWLFKISLEPVERQKGLIFISLRPWSNHDSERPEIFTEFLLKLKEEKHARFEFISMQNIREKDSPLLGVLAKRVGGEVVHPESFDALVKKLQRAEFAIGMRLHFLMAALLAGTPVIPLSYSPKVEAIFKGTPLEPYTLSADGLRVEQLVQTLKRLSVDYNNVKVYQKKRTDVLREEAQKTVALFSRFVADLEDSIDENGLDD